MNCKTFSKGIFILLCSATLLACDEEDNISPISNDVDSVSEFLLDGNGLRITLLTDDEDDETYYFDSYLFSFNSDGTVSATDANGTVNGTYSVFRDDERVEFQMSFPSVQNFSELNDDWYFISIKQNTIRFDDDDDILEFQQQ